MGWSAPTICKRKDDTATKHAKNKKVQLAEPGVGDDNTETTELCSRRRGGGGGGAWRAFLHRQGLQFKGHGQNLSAAYASLSVEDKAWYKDVGRQGALLWGMRLQ